MLEATTTSLTQHQFDIKNWTWNVKINILMTSLCYLGSCVSWLLFCNLVVMNSWQLSEFDRCLLLVSSIGRVTKQNELRWASDKTVVMEAEFFSSLTIRKCFQKSTLNSSSAISSIWHLFLEGLRVNRHFLLQGLTLLLSLLLLIIRSLIYLLYYRQAQ